MIALGVLGIATIFFASLEEESETNLHDIVIINALKNIKYDDYRSSDTHYERVDRAEKYYASMVEIVPTNSINSNIEDHEAIQITFDENHFEYGTNKTFSDSTFTAMVNTNDTFAVDCHSMKITSIDKDPVKQIGLLKYTGITEKDDIDYYGFVHEAGYISDSIDCVFPEIIEHSLNIDFNTTSNNINGDVWDPDWN